MSDSMRPTVSGTPGIVDFGARLVGNFFEHRTSTFAAALAYRGLFGLFPFALILVVVVAVLGFPMTLDQLVEEVGSRSTERVPEQLKPVVEQGREQVQPLEEVVEQAQEQSKSELLVFGIVLAMWSVSAVAGTLADAFNIAYGLTETRPWWKVALLSLASGPIVALVVVVAMLLMLVGPQAMERVAEVIGLRELFVVLWAWLRFPVALLLLGIALSVVYRHIPATSQPYKRVVPGAVLAVVAWAIASAGFSVYLANFANFGVTYGSLGAAVGLLLYLYLTASIVLLGAEVNAAIHGSAAVDPTRAEEPDAESRGSNAQGERTEDA